MDPTATWRNLADAFVARDAEGCREAIEALQGWLAKDGSPPTIVGKPAFDRVIVRAVCDYLLTLYFMKGDPPP